MSLIDCLWSHYQATTGPDGRYSLSVPGTQLSQCTQVRLQAKASGYKPLTLWVSVADLRDQPERDFGLISTGRKMPEVPTSLIRDRGDANGDCVIDLFDLIIVTSAYDPSGPVTDASADINEDGVIDLLDLVPVTANFGLKCPATW